MRIGLLIYGSLETLTGGYLYDKQLVEQLQAGGDEVVIFSLPWRNFVRHLADNFLPALWQQLTEAKIDVLIQDELVHPSVLWLNRQLRQKVDYPIVSLIHLLRFTEQRAVWQNQFYRWVEKSYLQSVDGIICNSQDSRQLVERLIGTSKPTVVAYPGRDHLPAFIPHIPHDPKSITTPLHLISVGNVVQRKGLHTLLAALERLPASAQWRLTIIGSLKMEADYCAGIQDTIKKDHWEDKINLLGSLPNEQIPHHLQQADLFVMVSQYEGFGIVYLEALGAGLPIIASTAGAAGEIVRQGGEGWLVAPDNPDELAKWLSWGLANRVQLQEMGKMAQQRFLDFPTWAENAGIIRDFLANGVKRWE